MWQQWGLQAGNFSWFAWPCCFHWGVCPTVGGWWCKKLAVWSVGDLSRKGGGRKGLDVSCVLLAAACCVGCTPRGLVAIHIGRVRPSMWGLNTSSWPDTRICRHVPKGKIKIIFPACRLNQKKFWFGFWSERNQSFSSMFLFFYVKCWAPSSWAEQIQTDIYKQVSQGCPFSARCFWCSGNEELECWEAAVGISSLKQ